MESFQILAYIASSSPLSSLTRLMNLWNFGSNSRISSYYNWTWIIAS